MAKLPGLTEYYATLGAPAINFGRGLLGYQDPVGTETMQNRMTEIEAGRTKGNVGYEDYGLTPVAGRMVGGLPELAVNNPTDFALAGSIGKYDFSPEGRTGLNYDFTPDQDTGSTGNAMLDYVNSGGVRNSLSNLRDSFSNMGSAQASEITQPQNLGFRSMVDMANDANNFDSQFSYPASQPQNLGFIESAPQPKEAIYQDRIMNNNLPSYGYEPKQGIMQGLQNKIGGLKDFLPFGDKSLSGMAVKGIKSLFERNPNSPSYQTRSPNIDYSNLNTTNLNDFYDSNPESETFGTTRFDRAVPGSFGSFRTLAGYLNRNKTAAAALTTKKAKKEAAMQQQIKDAQARQAVLDARQAAANRSGVGYRSDRDHSGSGGYGGSDKRSADNRSSDLGFSDIRLKDNIELVGKSPSNINIYNFTYLNDPKVYQGVMAQEVPWASVKHDSGYLMVDYSKVDVEFKRKDAVASMFTRRR